MKTLQTILAVISLTFAFNVQATSSQMDINNFHSKASSCRVEQMASMIALDTSIVNTFSRDGFTALMAVINRNCIDGYKLLIKHGADINLQDTIAGYTPLMSALEAAHRYSLDMLRLILKHPDLDMSIKDDNGLTALEIGEYELGNLNILLNDWNRMMQLEKAENRPFYKYYKYQAELETYTIKFEKIIEMLKEADA